ncbi:uncharacterized protein ATNIH1004_003531 [Aspergillus tanneri]|uniref:NmrA-like domain-containing protein n=1 Tax=Aspergillus tanneri TaxID=1220188 RepID=A0A5M9MUQ2_9EURO|nr:uncharacterized protein ATNIH1004_003531 [Aspergillus tanneri]KAA8650842.1 hypothetical protein ATNIH1004_003531 [Aspergillus tanneri]
MGVIAVSGGTGSVGRTIVEALVATQKHKVIVLTRAERASNKDITYLQVNYEDVDAASAVLESAAVDTVISALSMITEQSNEAQLNLIQAANKSKSTRRFVISAFDMYLTEEFVELVPQAKWQYAAISALEKTDLEYTRVVNGFFLDYYGVPHWPSHLKPWITSISVAGKWAVIPGDGTSKANFITTQDTAKFVARLMDLSKWPKLSSIVGEALTFVELVEIAEKVRGEKFRVIFDSLEHLAGGKISFPEFPEPDYGLSQDEFEAAVAGIHYLAASNAALVPTEDPLNNYFPDIKLTTAQEVIESSWKGR